MLWDSELNGFGVRVQKGGGKSYVLHYRVGTGRGAPRRKLTIGRHGSPWMPETARKEAKTLLGIIEDGADPAADKLARRETPTIAELAERFHAEHAEAKRKGSTAAEYKRLLDKTILPALGKRKVADVTRANVTKLHHANREAPYQANCVLAVLSKMFNLAERWGLRSDGSNPSLPPCREIRRAQARAHAVAGRAGAPRRRPGGTQRLALCRRGGQAAGVHRRAARRNFRAALGMDRFHCAISRIYSTSGRRGNSNPKTRHAAPHALSGEFARLYSPIGRFSISPERLLRALLLQAFYSIRSERQLVDRLDHDLLFRWFVGLGIEDPIWDATIPGVR